MVLNSLYIMIFLPSLFNIADSLVVPASCSLATFLVRKRQALIMERRLYILGTRTRRQDIYWQPLHILKLSSSLVIIDSSKKKG